MFAVQESSEYPYQKCDQYVNKHRKLLKADSVILFTGGEKRSHYSEGLSLVSVWGEK